MTVKSGMPKQKEQRDRKEKKAASIGGAVRDPEPEDVPRYGGALPREAESEGGRRPECRG